jgi:hypothetical protein
MDASSSPTSTNSSLSSSQRFSLDEHDTKKILVYNHPYGLVTSSQQDLCKILDNGMSVLASLALVVVLFFTLS